MPGSRPPSSGVHACCSGGCVRGPVRGPDANCAAHSADHSSIVSASTMRLHRTVRRSLRFSDDCDVGDDLAWDARIPRLPVPRAVRSTASLDCGSMTRSAKRWRSPTKVSDCQSVDRISVSKILSRGTAARAINARSNAAAAGDIRRRFIARPRDRRGHARWWSDEDHARCASRIQSADLPRRLVQTGLERFQLWRKNFSTSRSKCTTCP